MMSYFNPTHAHLLTDFAVLVWLCVYLSDDDLVEVETCRRNISDKLLIFIEFTLCWVKHCMVERPSPYRAVNTLRLGYKNQSVNAV
jgi:hypothetical protein